MSKHPNYTLRKLLVFSIGGLAIGTLGAAVIKISKSNGQVIKNDRVPASIVQSWGPVGVGKHLTPIRVVLENPEVPESGSTTVRIRGAIQAMQQVNESIRYKWILPEKSYVIEGNIEDELPSLESGKYHIVDIVIGNFSKEEFQNLSLEAKGIDSDIGGSASISSRPEDTMEAEGLEMRKAALKAEAAEKAALQEKAAE